MPLTIAERIHQMPFGGQREVAEELGVTKSYVSAVMGGQLRPKTLPARERLRAAQRALAIRLGQPVTEVFPEFEEEAEAPPMARAG